MKTVLILLAGGLLLLLGNGCLSIGSDPSRNLASVTITNQPDQAIVQATTNVFARHGFTAGAAGSDQLIFRRPGTLADNLAYGNALFDEKVSLQVVVKLSHVDTHATRLGCSAELVQEANDSFLEDTHPIHLLRKAPYEALLREIKRQLGQ